MMNCIALFKSIRVWQSQRGIEYSVATHHCALTSVKDGTHAIYSVPMTHDFTLCYKYRYHLIWGMTPNQI